MSDNDDILRTEIAKLELGACDCLVVRAVNVNYFLMARLGIALDDAVEFAKTMVAAEH